MRIKELIAELQKLDPEEQEKDIYVMGEWGPEVATHLEREQTLVKTEHGGHLPAMVWCLQAWLGPIE